MAKVYNTPGVYIQEKDAFPSSVVSVPTAVPAFIGYTEKAIRGTKDLTNMPTRITSLSEYVQLFGGGPQIKYDIDSHPKTNYTLSPIANTRFNMFYAMRFFYSNGGGPCYIVSVGDYDSSSGVQAKDLNDEASMSGLPTLLKEQEPTLIVIPDAVLLSANDCYSLQKAMITHCKTMMNRFAILDVHEGFKAPGGNDTVIKNFRSGVNLGGKNMQWAASYYPWLNTTLVQSSEIDFTAINNPANLVTLLKTENLALRPDEAKPVPPAASGSGSGGGSGSGSGSGAGGGAARTQIVPNPRRTAIDAVIDKIISGAPASAAPAGSGSGAGSGGGSAGGSASGSGSAGGSASGSGTGAGGGGWDATNPAHEEGITEISNTLKAVSPLFKDILSDLSKEINVMAPSSGMAGIYSQVDNDYGVQKAPANIGMVNVVSPTVNLSNEEQEDLNVPLNGLAVNAIRSFVGKGLLVWGARTLDGNSQDWKYVNVRRSMIMLEQSIKNAAESYVFAPNDANTWASVKSMIINFLTVQWRNGVLVGPTQDDAFIVDVGLGTTMTPTDILEGIMNITVKVAISRPAEFIVITFQQQMPKG